MHLKDSRTKESNIHRQLTSKMVGDMTVGPVTPFEAVPEICTFKPLSGETYTTRKNPCNQCKESKSVRQAENTQLLKIAYCNLS